MRIVVAKLGSDKKGQSSAALQKEGDILGAATVDVQMQQKRPHAAHFLREQRQHTSLV